MKTKLPAAAIAAACLVPTGHARAQDARPPDDAAPVATLGIVTVTGNRPSSLPSEVSTTLLSVGRERIERTVNATDAEDALKYLPSLLVRKRYPGDYNHAILSTRASGTGNSARSAVYADGILLSNYLGNGVGGLGFPPRWGMVTPEEIDRVDAMAGPFSAAYPGNSVGAVVDILTRMPTKLEAHARVGYVDQPVDLYATHTAFHAWQTSASVGDRVGSLAWWIDANRLDSASQPLTFATRLRSAGVAGGAGTVVGGAVPDLNTGNQPILVLGSGTQYRTQQDHLKIKLAWDATTTLRASYLFGLWRNTSDGRSASYLQDAAGQPVASGPVVVDGAAFANLPATATAPASTQALTGGDFPRTRESLDHTMHGLSLKSRTGGPWDGEIALSRYDYRRDDKRQNAASNPLPAAETGGAGTLADGSGTGWTTLALKGVWRPAGLEGAHVVDMGFQQERYTLRYRTSTIAGNDLDDPAGAFASQVEGGARLRSLYLQDAWRLAPAWTTVLGLRAERWDTFDGRTDFSATTALVYPSRRVGDLSPKAVIAWQARPETLVKLSVGRAVRMPTVSELYGATSTTNALVINDPNLSPEKSWTTELSAEQSIAKARARLTFFTESTRDAIYSQTLLDPSVNRNVTRVQNVDRIATTGWEAVIDAPDAFLPGLDLSASLTRADSKVRSNAGFVAVPGDTLDRWQPNIPRWRATAVASWRATEAWSATLAGRYSGRQYRTLNNADVNGFTYQGVSRFLTVDLRTVYRFSRQWSGALGIDNLNNDRYWNFHPYPQRSYTAELKFDL